MRQGQVPGLSVRINGDRFTFRCFRCEWSGSSYGVDTESAAADFTPQRPPDPAAMLELWRNGRLIEPGTVAASYLAARNCALPHPEGDLRWHPALRHPCGFVGPVLLALMTHAVTCAPLTLHSTWIMPDGSKADVNPPRLYWKGLPAGGVVRLWPDEEVTLGLLSARASRPAGRRCRLRAGLGVPGCLAPADSAGAGRHRRPDHRRRPRQAQSANRHPDRQ